MRILGVTISETLSVSDHFNNILGPCTSSTYALKTLRSRGMPALHEVARATMMARMIYASPAWRGYLTADDRERLERSNRRAIRAGFMPPDAPTVSKHPGWTCRRLRCYYPRSLPCPSTPMSWTPNNPIWNAYPSSPIRCTKQGQLKLHL